MVLCGGVVVVVICRCCAVVLCCGGILSMCSCGTMSRSGFTIVVWWCRGVVGVLCGVVMVWLCGEH